ncbi:MAG: hypothetical protein GYA69_00975 [Candidatus Moranbacteria bacterium]|nr:hypothetical protein [Candidatus Moranbacteria bacterium]
MKNVKEFSQFERAHLNKVTAKVDRAKKLERDKLESVSEMKRKNNA